MDRSDPQVATPIMSAGRVAGFGLLLALAALVAPPAGAIEPLTTAELNRFCQEFAEDPGSPEGIFCVKYIQGFIAGAVATDDRVARNVARRISGNDTFINTWAATRYGRQQREYEPTFFAEFCIGEDVPLADVVMKVVTDISDAVEFDETDLAREAVYESLREDFACE